MKLLMEDSGKVRGSSDLTRQEAHSEEILSDAQNEHVREGDCILLYCSDGRRWLIRTEPGKEFHTHRGIVKLSEIQAKRYGDKITSSLGATFWIVRPTSYDYIMKLRRSTQILYPKDIGFMLVRLGLAPGRIVVEAGTGSGALTISMANVVRPTGHVYSYEMRDEFADLAAGNLRSAGLDSFVTIRRRDAREGFLESCVDAVVLDLADPWEVIPRAYPSLKGGAHLASFSPTIGQVEKAVAALEEVGFINIETIESFLRNMRVERGRTRPHTRMIAHTGYITFATKVFK